MSNLNWNSPTKYAKRTLADALSKSYWGDVAVSEAVQERCADNEWIRERTRRYVSEMGKELWVMNHRPKALVENKHSALFFNDQRVIKGTPYLKSFRLEENLVLKITGTYKEIMELDFGPADFRGYIGEFEFISGK